MKGHIAVAAWLVLACPLLGAAPKPPTGKPVVVQVDKGVDFTAFRTYSYEAGYPAMVKEVDARIVADIEAQLAALGLTRAASGPGDVVVSYFSVMRTDVDLASFDARAPQAGTERKAAETFKVGTLVMNVKAASTGKVAWRAKIEGVLTGDTAAQLAVIDGAVASVFNVYPTRTKK